MRHKRKQKLTALVLLLTALILSYVLVVIYFLNEKNRIYDHYEENLKNQYEITLSIYADMSELIFRSSINTGPILGLLHKAYNTESPELKNFFRDELYKSLHTLYDQIIRYNFRQLHFHEGNNRSFLRVHKPEFYGDDLSDIRFSVVYVNREKKPISGFEEGRIFNGYRFVYPLFLSEDYLGSVEISVSMQTVIDQLYEKFHQKSQLILLRSIVEEKVFESEQDNYEIWPVNERFMLDRDISGDLLLDPGLSSKDRIALDRAFSDPENKDEPFSVNISYEGKKQIVTFLPIHNFTDLTVAYLFTLNSTGNLVEQRNSFWIISIVFVLLILSLIVFILYYYRSDKIIEKLIIFDQLTGAYSRNSILERVSTAIERYKRYKSPCSIAMIDIDHFKNVNDSYGHLTGDAVLFELSHLIQNSIRKTDLFGRFGGEEFLLLLEETPKEQAVQVVENLRKLVEENSFDKAGTITISCGIAEMTSGQESLQQLLEAADSKLYRAKETGRNKVVF